jgi:hypothetical protein
MPGPAQSRGRPRSSVRVDRRGRGYHESMADEDLRPQPPEDRELRPQSPEDRELRPEPAEDRELRPEPAEDAGQAESAGAQSPYDPLAAGEVSAAAAAAPPPPKLPEVDSPPAEDVLDSVVSTEEIIEDAQSAEEILSQQPSVDELLGRDR